MRHSRGASLLAILGLVSVLSFLAAAMTALFLQGLHFTQGSFNGDVALSQAEAGLHEAIVRLGQDDECSFGKNGESLQGSISGEFSGQESNYRVSFASGGGPHSTNNVDGNRPLGYLNRALGTGTIHVISQGTCRGQVRTIEALLRRPDCPYGIASSGPIQSRTPLIVYGTDSVGEAQSENYRRPGHIVSNSTSGIRIERPTGTPGTVQTEVSGFIQSVGPIQVDLPARVASGLRPHASSVELPRFDITGELNPLGLPGTVNYVGLEHGAQELDVIYHANHDITFLGPLKLHDAYLYVNGKLKVQGGISGTGAIVVNGDVEVDGGISLLSDSNNIALLSTGKVTLVGSSNYFQGFVYAEKGVVAEKLTVVGSLILNHREGQPEPPMELDEVILVNTQSESRVTFTARSYSYTTQQMPTGRTDYVAFDWGSMPEYAQNPDAMPGSSTGGFTEEDLPDKLEWVLLHGVSGDLMSMQNWVGSYVAVQHSAGPSFNGVEAMARTLMEKKTRLIEATAELAAIPDTPANRQRRQDLQLEIDQLNTDGQALLGQYEQAAREFIQSYTDFVRSHSNSDGSRRLSEGAAPPDVERTYTLDLNRYLPAADRLHVTYCRYYNQRL